ncbi:hypothetical protein B0H11DRAFT_1941976 [Mycena galericulata]|nr:hypothetical protein B0H11DRAFT_1941976 [Mycena galericulata]
MSALQGHSLRCHPREAEPWTMAASFTSTLAAVLPARSRSWDDVCAARTLAAVSPARSRTLDDGRIIHKHTRCGVTRAKPKLGRCTSGSAYSHFQTSQRDWGPLEITKVEKSHGRDELRGGEHDLNTRHQLMGQQTSGPAPALDIHPAERSGQFESRSANLLPECSCPFWFSLFSTQVPKPRARRRGESASGVACAAAAGSIEECADRHRTTHKRLALRKKIMPGKLPTESAHRTHPTLVLVPEGRERTRNVTLSKNYSSRNARTYPPAHVWRGGAQNTSMAAIPESVDKHSLFDDKTHENPQY